MTVYHDADDDEPFLFKVETFDPEEMGWARRERSNPREIVYEAPDGTYHVWPKGAVPRITKMVQ
jgi:hypothetical protein